MVIYLIHLWPILLATVADEIAKLFCIMFNLMADVDEHRRLQKKAEELLNQNTYRDITSDPTMRLKNKLISILRSIKTKGGMSEEVLWAPKDT